MTLSFFLVCLAGVLPADEVLVTPRQLAGMEEVLVVDARAEEDFLRAHIPGAAHLDVETLSETRDNVIGQLRPAEAVLPLLAEAGLAPERHIVVYSGHFQEGEVKRATRLFWILEHLGYTRVSLLDGGLAKWQAEDRPVEKGPSTVAAITPDDLAGLGVPSLLAERDDIVAMLDTQHGTLIDFRVADEYAGKSKKEFVGSLGHIQGAQSCPAGGFYEGPYFEFKTGEALRAVLGDVTLKEGQPIITYCNTGRDATIGYLGLRLSGVDGVLVYDGSMAEWGNLPGAKVE